MRRKTKGMVSAGEREAAQQSTEQTWTEADAWPIPALLICPGAGGSGLLAAAATTASANHSRDSERRPPAPPGLSCGNSRPGG
ncbi:hypothetical protein [Streptomyces sp. NPDC055287]